MRSLGHALALLAIAGASAAADPATAVPAPPSPEPPSATPPAPPDHSAADVVDAPFPGAESGRTDPIDPGDSALRRVGRAVLLVPKLVFELVSFPFHAEEWLDDNYDLSGLYYRTFFNSARTIGVYPTATYETGFGASLGVRFQDNDLFGERESVALQATTGAVTGEVYREGALISLGTGDRISHRFQLGVDANFDRRPADPFYGIGNGNVVPRTTAVAPIDPLVDPTAVETYNRYQEARVAASANALVIDHLRAIASGALTDLAFSRSEEGIPIDEVYDPNTLVGFERGVRHLYGELEVRWDSRRRPVRWEPPNVDSTGFLAAAFAGRIDGLDGSASYWRYGGELQRYWRLARGPRFLVTRLHLEAVTGSREAVPFAELPTLGGGTFLRGYTFDWFRDRVAAVGSLQYEWDISRLLDAYLFTDAGRVYPAFDELTVRGLRVGFGIGLELHNDRGFLLEGNIASSIDGGVLFNLSFNPILDSQARWR